MVALSLKVSNQLAEQLIPLQNRSPEIIELSLRHWQEQEDEQAPLLPPGYSLVRCNLGWALLHMRYTIA